MVAECLLSPSFVGMPLCFVFFVVVFFPSTCGCLTEGKGARHKSGPLGSVSSASDFFKLAFIRSAFFFFFVAVYGMTDQRINLLL